MQSQMALREKAASALGELVERGDPRAAGRRRDAAPDCKTSACACRHRASASSSTSPPPARTSQRFVEELRAAGREAVKVDLALRAVAEAEAIEVDDDELDAEIERLAERTEQKPNQVRKVIERNGQIPELRSDLRKRKALEWLVENVEIVDADGQPIDREDLVPDVGRDRPERSRERTEPEDEKDEE